MSAPGHTLAIHPGALGDVLLAVPALRALGQAGGAPVVLAAQPRIGALLGALGAVDRAVAFDALGLERLFDDNAPAGAPALAEASRVVSWFGAGDPTYVRRLRAQVPEAVVAPSKAADGTVWQHLLRTVEATADPDRAPLAVSAALREEGAALLRAAGWDGRARLLLVHPGAGGVAKRWPAEGFAAGLAGLAPDLTLVVHRGPADDAPVVALHERLSRPALVLEEPPLRSLAGALAHVTGYLGNDSGISHLAAAVGAPTLVLFAPANLAWTPWSPSARWLVVRMDGVEPADVRAVTDAVERLVAAGVAP